MLTGIHSFATPSTVEPQWNMLYWRSKLNFRTVCASADFMSKCIFCINLVFLLQKNHYIEVCCEDVYQLYVGIDSDNHLTPTRRQAVIWPKMASWCIYASYNFCDDDRGSQCSSNNYHVPIDNSDDRKEHCECECTEKIHTLDTLKNVLNLWHQTGAVKWQGHRYRV